MKQTPFIDDANQKHRDPMRGLMWVVWVGLVVTLAAPFSYAITCLLDMIAKQMGSGQ